MALFLANSSLMALLLGSIGILLFAILILIINIIKEIKEGKLEYEILIILTGLIICFILPVIIGLLNRLI